MGHYLQDVLSPKQKQTTEEQKSQDQSYEERHKRAIRDDWKVNRPWLRVETNANGDEVMFCDFCVCVKPRISSDKTSFVKGCTILKLKSLQHHETSSMHLFSAKKYTNE